MKLSTTFSATLSTGAIALTMAFGSSALAANIYVRNTMGSDLSSTQVHRITQEVKNAVTKDGKNSLANSERDSDFVLQPSIIQRGDQLVLRVEKEKDGSVIGMNEQPVSSSTIDATDASSVADIALQDNQSATDDDSSMAPMNDNQNYGQANQSRGWNSGHQGGWLSNNHPAANNNRANSRNFNNRALVNENRADFGTVSGATSSGNSNDMNNDMNNDNRASMPAADSPRVNREATSGDIRAPSPRMLNDNRPGYFQIGVGNSFGIGMKSDENMYNLDAGYHSNLDAHFTAKGILDANLATGDDAAHFIDLAVGADYYPNQSLFSWGAPYIGADLGYAFVRDGNKRTQDAPAVAADAGFKFQALQLNWDLAVRYTILTEQLDDKRPSLFGGHVAVNF
jgi:hypothetical protein